jgi:hypothetical protein
MENPKQVLDTIIEQATTIESQTRNKIILSGRDMLNYHQIMEHVKTETDRLYAEMQALVSPELRQRADELRYLVDNIEELRCFAISENQKEEISRVYRDTVNREVTPRPSFTPYDERYALVHAITEHFPVESVVENKS